MAKLDKKTNPVRQNWGKEYSSLPKLDLLAVQKSSYKWFLETGIGDILREISPIDDFTEKNWGLEFKKYRIGKTSNTPETSLSKGLVYDAPLYVETTLTNKKTNATMEQEVFLGDIPQMTDRGTFIINGVERTVVSQLVRSPGVFFTAVHDNVTGKKIYTAEIRPIHGSWLEFSTTRHETLTVKIDRRRKFLEFTFLRAIGFSSNEDIKEPFRDMETHSTGSGSATSYIENTLQKDETGSSKDAIIEIFKKMHPGEPVVFEKVKENFDGLFFNARRYDLGEVGRYKINKKLKGMAGFAESDVHILTREDILGAISYLIKLAQGQKEVDDIDSLANRRVRRVGELVAVTAFRVGVLRLERSVKERMSLIQPDVPPSIGALINARP